MTVSYGSLPLVAGQTAVIDVGGDGYRGVICGNESGLTVIVGLDGTGYGKTLYPGTVDYFKFSDLPTFTGNVVFKNSSMLNNIAQWPSSFVQVDAVGIHENINEAAYPYALPRTVTGNVNAVSVGSSLSNEGSADGTEVIDIGTESNNKLLDIFNDHFSWSVEQTDVAHQVLKGQTAGNPLQIGQTGDITEVLGKLVIDQSFTALGASSLDNANIITDGAGEITFAAIDAPVGADFTINHDVGRATFFSEGDVNKVSITSEGIRYVHAASDGFLTALTGQSIWAGDIGTPQAIQLRASGIGLPVGSNISFNVGQIREFNTGNVTTASSVVVNHGLSSTPSAVWASVKTAAASATIGCASYTSTQFTLLNGANPTSLNFQWVAYRT
jgi:hypothetical protein